MTIKRLKDEFNFVALITGMLLMAGVAIIAANIAVDYNDKLEAQQSYRGLYEDVVREDSLTILEALGLWH